MGLAGFLSALFDGGRVRVGGGGALSAEELAEADEVLAEIEADVRTQWPCEPPGFSVEVGRWAAVTFYRAAQLAVFRDADEATIRQAMATPCPDGSPASAHYSADLVLRFLPDLARLARAAAEGDPLLERLMELAASWPLSSVGMKDVEFSNAQPGSLDPVVDHPSLLGTYVDRIIRHGDVSRLHDVRVRRAVGRAIGELPQLAPKMAAAIEKLETEEAA